TPHIVNNPQHPYTQALISAVCEPDPALARGKDPIPLRSAEIPDLTDLPPGCDFHPRCPLYTPGSCDTERPPLVRGPERLLACHVVNGQGSKRASPPRPFRPARRSFPHPHPWPGDPSASPRLSRVRHQHRHRRCPRARCRPRTVVTPHGKETP